MIAQHSMRIEGLPANSRAVCRSSLSSLQCKRMMQAGHPMARVCLPLGVSACASTDGSSSLDRQGIAKREAPAIQQPPTRSSKGKESYVAAPSPSPAVGPVIMVARPLPRVLVRGGSGGVLFVLLGCNCHLLMFAFLMAQLGVII